MKAITAGKQSKKEVDDLHQRTREGIETARRNEKQIGQKFGTKLKVRKKFPVQQLIFEVQQRFVNAGFFLTENADEF